MTQHRSHSRHGLNALKARVKIRGLSAIDRRSVAAQALLAWRVELLQDLGGEAAVSAQQMALVEAAVRTRLYVDHLDAWLMEHGSLVNARRRAVHPVVRERQQLVDSLARLLTLLGLERRKRPVLDLGTYLAQRAGATRPDGDVHGPSPAAPDPAMRSGGAADATITAGPRTVTPPEGEA